MLTLTYADLKTLMRDLKGIGAHNAASSRKRGLLGKSAWGRLEQAYESHRLAGRLPATFEVIYGHAWVGDKTRREDGRQVIQFNIGERRRGLGHAMFHGLLPKGAEALAERMGNGAAVGDPSTPSLRGESRRPLMGLA